MTVWYVEYGLPAMSDAVLSWCRRCCDWPCVLLQLLRWLAMRWHGHGNIMEKACGWKCSSVAVRQVLVMFRWPNTSYKQ